MVIELDEQTKFQPSPEKYQVYMPQKSTALLVGTKEEEEEEEKEEEEEEEAPKMDSTYQCIYFINNKNILYLKSVLST
jgi:hypothetical protein